jgi:hypothetical protein
MMQKAQILTALLLSSKNLNYTIRNCHNGCCYLVDVLKAKAVACYLSHAHITPTFLSRSSREIVEDFVEK